MARAKNEAERGWITLEACEAAIGCNRAAFDKSWRPLVPADCIRTKGRQVFIRFRGLMDASTAREVAKVREALGAGDDALVYAGGDSPNLERLRAAKARLAEMDLDERKGTHADLADLDQSLKRFGGLIRRAGDVLQRKFGSDAATILNDAIDTAESEWARK